MLQLRPHQEHGLQLIRKEVAQGRKRICCVAPTGYGKTEIAVAIIRNAMQRGHTVWFMAPMQALVKQTSARLDRYGIDHGVIWQNHPRTNYANPVQVCSRDTVYRRLNKVKAPDIIIGDEWHMGTYGKALSSVCDAFPDALWICLTATPIRLDGRGMGHFCDSLVTLATINELMHDGWLIPYKLYRGQTPDLSDIKTSGGDYNQRDLANRMDRRELFGNYTRDWMRYAKDRKTLAFACSIEHSKHIAAEFNNCGIPAAHVDSLMPGPQFDREIRRLRAGEITLLSSVGKLTTGFDEPGIGALLMARPTKSLGLYIQMVGRGLRPEQGRALPGEHCVVLDHAGLRMEHGHVTDEQHWTLSDRPKQPAGETRQGFECPECRSTLRGWPSMCPECGAELPASDRERCAIPACDDSELVLDDPRTERDQRRETYAACVEWAMRHAAKPAAVDQRFRAIWKEYPKRADMKQAIAYTKWAGAGTHERIYIDPATRTPLCEIGRRFDYSAGPCPSSYTRLLWQARDQLRHGCNPEHVARRQELKAIAIGFTEQEAATIAAAVRNNDLSGDRVPLEQIALFAHAGHPAAISGD